MPVEGDQPLDRLGIEAVAVRELLGPPAEGLVVVDQCVVQIEERQPRHA
ncbi:hypothetical protein [Microbispora sp. GKU 823]|nr:hypothetical protein [Microbispora sp. GKU 823]